MPILSHERVRAGEETPRRRLFLLHGIYGRGRNWGTVARRLVEARPDWEVVLVDLRLHGGSQGFAPPHTLEACAEDVRALAASLGGPPDVVLGHSFGGKVALTLATRVPPARTWCVDASPSARAPSGLPWRMLEILERLPAEFQTREEAIRSLTAAEVPDPVARWMGTNLERTGGTYRWIFDPAALRPMLDDYYARDLWPVLEAPGHPVVHVVAASGSTAIEADDVDRLERAVARDPDVHLHRIEGGHWVNVDNPDALLGLLHDHLPAGS